ncbi:TPA: tRNA (adenosine(37)-N6)-threonylcarbamoyltransferase complex transferase subunit TsaD [Candidatus Scatousia excrementigallinarum]|uniref:tRNA N6-adenosine threonylcarbamoyltransferase n=1 Tax=Candidatus Scatousia excrementigallinarum TaxID=2840935 RepID=A0A9D1EXC6_9BACT|nr:tRNA (adenosine(37)-N6)-threonylcarbamoyltransferase complex transferase subunit TsaD [Candidatus Scatousia excrementigallinarum]
MKNIKETLFTKKNIEIGPESGYDNYIMAIESSCDETACAIVKNGREVIANVVASQIKTHAKFGGVIPEIAAREHLDSINIVIEEAFSQAKDIAGINPEDITAFAGTVGPGLVGCLLVGLNAAKTLALVYDKPFIGVNHLNAHLCGNYIDTELKPPFMALLVSGGHTQIIDVKSYSEQYILGETIDDAVGEAYDKVARLIGLPYPGGPRLDKLAQEGNPKAFHLPEAKVDGYNFSFSGLKTAVLRLVKSFDGKEMPVNDICASFQECVSSTLLKKLKRAAEEKGYKQIVIAGGVAANSEIRRKIFSLEKEGYSVFAPSMKYCTDNAAMVASCAYFNTNTFDDINVEVFSRVK